MKKPGMSLVEILVALTVIALALGPLIALLSSSNRASNASIYEVMAVHYAGEMSEQLQRLAPNLGDILTEARTTSGNLALTVEGLFNNLQLETAMSQVSSQPVLVQIPNTNVGFLLSPLDQNFDERKVTVSKLDDTGFALLGPGNYYDFKITLKWKVSPSEPTGRHSACFSVILKE